MTTVRLGGVPEHFNYPWHKAMSAGAFEKEGVDIHWKDYPGGTGAMVQDLAEGKLDMAVLLTEGAVAAATKGCPIKLMHFTVTSPLVWGIHTGAGSGLHSVDDIPGKIFAISRFGSGSHLMAIVQALLKDWPIDHMHWKEVKNLDGAKTALVANEADVFLWERFMTKPLVDEGSFRLLGLLPTPWSSFVLVVRDSFLQQTPSVVEAVSKTLLATQQAMKQDPDLSLILAQRYGLQRTDVDTWLSQTTWEQQALLSEKEVDAVSDLLVKAGVLEQAQPAIRLTYKVGQHKK